jgi:CcmD family protein
MPRSSRSEGWRRKLLWVSVLVCCVCGPLAAAWAQEATSPNDRAQTFEAVTGPVKEDIAGGPLMLWAYAVVWIVVFGYVLRLVRLHRGVEESLARVERAVAAATPKDAG